MCDKHRFFFGTDPRQPEYPSNERAISARVAGNWIVRCGHCGESLMGHQGHEGATTELLWQHNADSWFGSFTILE